MNDSETCYRFFSTDSAQKPSFIMKTFFCVSATAKLKRQAVFKKPSGGLCLHLAEVPLCRDRELFAAGDLGKRRVWRVKKWVSVCFVFF